VVSDYRFSPYETDTPPAMFVLYDQQPLFTRSPIGMISRNRMSFVLRTAGNPSSLVPEVRAAVAAIDRNQPLVGLQTIDEDVASTTALSRHLSIMFALLAGVALLLAAVGTYGVISQGVNQRAREIGIRMALGARSFDVVASIVGGVIALAAVGVGAGVTGALTLVRTLPSAVAGLVWGIAPTDVVTYVAASLLMVLAAVLAAWLPARRAVRVAPTAALRCE
jgi:ABC-type antimicrobial peptide transport system permease subunit